MVAHHKCSPIFLPSYVSTAEAMKTVGEGAELIGLCTGDDAQGRGNILDDCRGRQSPQPALNWKVDGRASYFVTPARAVNATPPIGPPRYNVVTQPWIHWAVTYSDRNTLYTFFDTSLPLSWLHFFRSWAYITPIYNQQLRVEGYYLVLWSTSKPVWKSLVTVITILVHRNRLRSRYRVNWTIGLLHYSTGLHTVLVELGGEPPIPQRVKDFDLGCGWNSVATYP